MTTPVFLMNSTAADGKPAGGSSNPIVTSFGATDSAALNKIGTPQVTSDLVSAVISINTATTTPIVAAATAQTTQVYRLRLNVGAAQTVTVKDGSTTLEVINFTGAGFLTYDFSTRPWYKTSANSALNLTTSTTAQVNGVVEYITSA